MKMNMYYVVLAYENDMCDYVAGPFGNYGDAYERFQEETKYVIKPYLYRVVEMIGEVK